MSTGQDKHILARKIVACFPIDILSLFPKIAHRLQPWFPSSILDPDVYQTSPLTTAVPCHLVHSSVVSIVTLYLGSRSSTLILNVGSDLCSHISILRCPRVGWRYDQYPGLQRQCAANLTSPELWDLSSLPVRALVDCVAVMLQFIMLNCSLQVFVSTWKRCSVEQGLYIYSPSLKCVITEMSVRNTPDEQCHVYYTEYWQDKSFSDSFMLNRVMKSAWFVWSTNANSQSYRRLIFWKSVCSSHHFLFCPGLTCSVCK
jgi:hypothetical protein